MNTNLFRLALEHLKPSDWAHFETLCSDFLAAEFTNLRTLADPSGDGGRDSELFAPQGHPNVAFQYSVTGSWRNKVRHTVKRLSKKHPEVKIPENHFDYTIETGSDAEYLELSPVKKRRMLR